MSLKQSLKSLAEKILPQSVGQNQSSENEELQNIHWFNEQKRKLDAGEELEPPWISFPDSDPLTLWVSWRYGNHWLDTIWKPFWHSMDEDQQAAYLEKWQPPSDEWYQNVAIHWGKPSE